MIEFDGFGAGAAVVSCLLFVSTCSLFVQRRLRGIPLLRQSLSCVEYSLVGLSLDFLLDWLAWYICSRQILVEQLVLLFSTIQSPSRRVLS